MPQPKEPKKQPVSKEKSSPFPVKESKNPKSKDKPITPPGDSTARVSISPQPSQPGPAAESTGPTTDTRAAESKKPGTKKEQDVVPQPKATPDLIEEPTASEIAAAQPLRQSDLPLPTEQHQVDGETVTLVATPARVDPIELKPSKADTAIKDRARAEGLAIAADAPVNRAVGGDILDGKVGETRFKEQKNGDLIVEGGFDG